MSALSKHVEEAQEPRNPILDRKAKNADQNSSQLAYYLDLCKPRIVSLILVTTALGFFLGHGAISSWRLFALTLFGTTLSCAGACALNNFLERDIDQYMKRTKKRALPSGAIPAHTALAFGVITVLLGTTILAVYVNLLSGFLSLLTSFLYVLVYTPLKRLTWLNTLVGAIPGALPPMGGFAAATGELGIGAWALFAILFVWQQPHFYAIAWMYKDDYARAGFKMLPVIEPDGLSTFRQIVIYSVLLIPISLAPSLLGYSGNFYLFGATLAGLLMLREGVRLSRSHSAIDARRVLRASIAYLPALLLLIVLDVRF